MTDRDELRRWADLAATARMAREESRRTVLVQTAELAVQAEAIAAAAGVGDLITVRVSPLVPVGQMFVVDERAVAAGLRESLQHASGRRASGG